MSLTGQPEEMHRSQQALSQLSISPMDVQADGWSSQKDPVGRSLGKEVGCWTLSVNLSVGADIGKLVAKKGLGRQLRKCRLTLIRYCERTKIGEIETTSIGYQWEAQTTKLPEAEQRQ